MATGQHIEYDEDGVVGISDSYLAPTRGITTTSAIEIDPHQIGIEIKTEVGNESQLEFEFGLPIELMDAKEGERGKEDA